MQIQVFRHGIAIDREHPSCPPDLERFLTDRGKSRTAAAAQGLVALGIRPAIVMSSPWLRAHQTAEIACQALDYRDDPTLTEALLWDAPPADLLGEIARTSADEVMVVGHAPHLDLLIAHVTGATRAFTRVKKAGLAILEWNGKAAGTGDLVGLYSPRSLRTLGVQNKQA